jgi:hypothetical protein
MKSVYNLANDVLEKAEKIKEETKDWKRESEYLINEQINELDRVAEKEAKLFSSKDSMNKADDNLNSVISINGQTKETIAQVKYILNVLKNLFNISGTFF